MSKKDLSLAKKYLKWLKFKSVVVKAGYIFGSRSKGSAHEGSDLDICIISDSFGKDKHAARVKLMNYGLKVSDLIEPHLLTVADFEDKYNPLAVEVKKTGIKIV